MSNHYVVHLKLIQHCVASLSQQNWWGKKEKQGKKGLAGVKVKGKA